MVLVAWEEQRTARAVDELQRRVSALDSPHPSVVVVRNRPVRIEETMQLQVIDSDNRCWEFSGWIDGIDSLPTRLGPLVLANDRFPVYSYPHLAFLTGDVLRSVSSGRLLLGRLDRAKPSVVTPWGELTHWLTTTFLVTSREALERTGGLIAVDEVQYDERVDVRFDRGIADLREWLGSAYAEFLVHWVTQPGSWHAATALSNQTWPAIRLKLRSIVNEHALTLRALEAGLSIASSGFVAASGGLVPDGSGVHGATLRERAAATLARR